MKLWTIQPIEFWSNLQRDKKIEADSELVDYNPPWLYYMASKLKEISKPYSSYSEYPIWGNTDSNLDRFCKKK